MQEYHRLVMGAQSRFPVAQYPSTRRAQPVACCDNIVDLVAEMVHAAGRVFVEKAAQRRIGAERLQQFDLAVGQFDEDNSHAMRRQRLWRGNAGAESVA